jgi:hypothetical protein
VEPHSLYGSSHRGLETEVLWLRSQLERVTRESGCRSFQSRERGERVDSEVVEAAIRDNMPAYARLSKPSSTSGPSSSG